jgi:hypothetical protein
MSAALEQIGGAASLPYVVDVFVGPDGRFAVAVRAPAWHDGAAQWAVYCPFCGALHRHGRRANDSLHRIAHCVYAEPGGYWLVPMPGQHPTRRPTILADVALAARRARNARASGRRAPSPDGHDANA